MDSDYDVVVVGAGPGGYVAAIRAGQLGLKTAIVEREALGGVCLNWGCIPSKALLKNAEVVSYFHRAEEFGLSFDNFSADYAAAVDRSRKVVDRNVRGVAYLLRKNKVDHITGEGKLTGRPGICFAPRGPGATNASAGIHVALQDSTPMILFVGQIARGDTDRDAFQEVDYRAMFGPLVKWVAQIDQTDRIAEYVARAFHVACSGRPGPVVLALPEDMLSGRADIPDLPPARKPLAEVAPEAASAIAEALTGAARPLVIAGGGLWSQVRIGEHF